MNNFPDPRIETLPGKLVVGKVTTLSFAMDTTPALFRSFMPHRNTIPDRAGTDLLCVQQYPQGFFTHFDPTAEFRKWAAVEVNSVETVPDGMESLAIPAGLYAVFIYKGRASDADPFFRYIYGTWMPASGYELDTRPHFDVLGEKYKNDSADSEEEVWIPIRKKE